MLRAIIFDCDGVIADTEPLHYRAFVQVLRGLVPLPSEREYFLKYVGLTDEAFVATLFAEAGRPIDADRLRQLVRDKAAVYRAMIDGGLALLPGVEAFIRLVAPRWPLAICSGALRGEIEYLLAPRGLLFFFAVIVSAESVPTSKPDPGGYLLVCRLLAEKFPGITAGECLVIEDSRHGVAAAQSAGMKVLAVGPLAQTWRSSPADATAVDLTQVSAERLATLFR